MNVKESNTTVIITTYKDTMDDLTRAVSSAINQTLPPKQIIVVDDGSCDDTSQLVVARITAKTSVPVTLLLKNNGGPSSARNVGLFHCTTKYVTFLDSDDEMLGNNLETKESCLRLLGDDYFGIYGTYIKQPGGLHQYMDHDGLINTDLVGWDGGIPGGVPTYLFNTKHLISTGGFDENLVHNEDFDLIIRLAKQGLKTKGSLGAGFIRNYRENSISRNIRHVETYNNVNRFLAKAEANNYFSLRELTARRAGNEYRLARELLKKKGYRLQGLSHLNTAYGLSKKPGVKRFCALLLVRVILRLSRLS